MTNILAVIGTIVLILRAATIVSGALAELLRSCQPVVTELRALRNECNGGQGV
ncbi:hypothetical protein [Nocardia nepalensis]|uniref:hypothetical protein n=1 Tax=Nocardia nepalensis TaxID=3375448 RepID=UPI003B6736C4